MRKLSFYFLFFYSLVMVAQVKYYGPPSQGFYYGNPQNNNYYGPPTQSRNDGTHNNKNKDYDMISAPKGSSWTKYSYGGSIFTKYHKYENGVIYAKTYNRCGNCRGTHACPVCHGTKICSACRGRGAIVIGNYYNPCMCIAGVCKTCSGKGICLVCDAETPGFVFVRDAFYTPDGYIIDSKGFRKPTVDGGSNDNANDKSIKNNTTCKNCGGTGVDPTGQAAIKGVHRTPTRGETSSRTGDRCQYCKREDYHYHLWCPYCEKGQRRAGMYY